MKKSLLIASLLAVALESVKRSNPELIERQTKQSYADAEYNSWEVKDMRYFRFCAGCSYCLSGWECLHDAVTKPHKLDWE